VQYAVDRATAGDEVLVATGVYTGVQARAGISQVVYISKTVAVRGGYRPDFGAWDPEIYSTTVDAEDQGRVIFASGPGITLTLEGLRLTGGTAMGPNEGGGGLYLSTASLFVHDCTVYSNTAESYGGGLYLDQATGTLEANTIQSNTVLAPAYYHGGGGIYAASSELALGDNLIQHNTSGERAGGVYLGGGRATIVGNAFTGNRGIGREGGGLHLRNGTATLADNTFRDNAAHWGGGVYADQGTITLTHNLFVSNAVTVYSGGAVTLLYGGGRLEHNLILSNTANGRGGGVHFYQASVALDSNRFHHNRTQDNGGGLSALGGNLVLINNVFADNRAGNDGGGFQIVGATAHLWHTTLARNGSSAAWIEGGTAWFTNTLVYSHTIGLDNVGGAVTLTQTLWDAVWTPTLGSVTEAGSFTGTAALDADGYHLTAASEAMNAALFSAIRADVDGERRPMGPAPDLGADEYPYFVLYLPLVLR
jgi:parallel beta-helix repeat protein